MLETPKALGTIALDVICENPNYNLYLYAIYYK